MLQMNYGCGSTVDPRDLRGVDRVVYVGVGGGLEALQFAYFLRRRGAVIAVDPVAEMRQRAEANFREAARVNSWFRPEFVDLRDGTALSLPVESNSVGLAAQNCLFNVFRDAELEQALAEVARVLRVGGVFVTSDPITPEPLPEAFRADDVARARCLAGCQTIEEYLDALVHAGFGRIDIRARRPYRLVTPAEFRGLTHAVLLESVEVAAYKVPDGVDGPAIFSGRCALYGGAETQYVDESGMVLSRGIPVPVSDAAARRLSSHRDITLTGPTYHARGGGCC